MLKKIFIFTLLVIGLAGCSDKEVPAVVNSETQKPKETATSNLDSVTIEKSPKQEVFVLATNEPFNIETEYGSYIITLTGVFETDWWQRTKDQQDKHVVVLEYIIENIDFSNEQYPGVTVSENALSLYDENSFILNEFNTWYKEFKAPTVVLPGYKGKFGIGYILESPSHSFEATFTRGDKVIFKANIPLNEKKIISSNSNDDISSTVNAVQSSSSTTYPSGHHKVGSDIPAGLYIALANGGNGYFSVTSDSNGDVILFNGIFANHIIFEIKDGEYLELNKAYALPYENAPLLEDIDGVLKEGMYLVGEHLSAGEYKLNAISGNGYYAIYNDARHQDIISNNIFSGSRYVTVKDGQYLVLSKSELVLN